MFHARLMSYAVIQDLAASWDLYLRLAKGFNDEPPQGLILYLAGPTDEGIRIIGVWDDEESWHRFRRERLEGTTENLPLRAITASTFRDLHGRQLIFGERVRPPPPPMPRAGRGRHAMRGGSSGPIGDDGSTKGDGR